MKTRGQRARVYVTNDKILNEQGGLEKKDTNDKILNEQEGLEKKD